MSRRGAPWRSLSTSTRSGTQRRWEWCVCHLLDAEGSAANGGAAGFSGPGVGGVRNSADAADAAVRLNVEMVPIMNSSEIIALLCVDWEPRGVCRAT